jgi:hypothetical protein
MALIKQGRAAGLGVVLATQNPADLDYKGLTNAGTWAVGALRAERDKERVLEGLEGATAEAGAALDRRTLDRALGALKPRVFLLHDIREGRPVFFHTRWAMSYLCGPLTRRQVRDLMGGAPAVAEESPTEPVAPSAKEGPPEPMPSDLSAIPPALPPDIPQVFLPPTITFEWALRSYEEQAGRSVLAQERRLVYTPHLLALGVVRMLDRKRGVDTLEAVARLVQPGEGPVGVDWEEGEAGVSEDDLSPKPMGEGGYAPVPAPLARSRDLKRMEKDFADYLYHNVSAAILYNSALDLYGGVGESRRRRDFRVRCEEEARRQRGAELKKARARAEKQIDSVQKKLRREGRELDADEGDLAARKREEVLSLGESALNLFSRQGRRRATSAISRASRKRRMTKTAEADVEESLEAIGDFEQQLEDLKAQWEEQVAEIGDRWADTLEEIEEVAISPRRADVTVEFCGLAWVPAWQVTLEDGRHLDLPARQPAAQAE